MADQEDLCQAASQAAMTGGSMIHRASVIGGASGRGAAAGIDGWVTSGKSSNSVAFSPGHITEVPNAVFERLLELTCGSRGMMQGLALDIRKRGAVPHSHIGMVVYARKQELVVGWTIIDYSLTAEIYVDRDHRRQGIATGLLRKMHEVRGATDGHYFMPYVKQIIERARAA